MTKYTSGFCCIWEKGAGREKGCSSASSRYLRNWDCRLILSRRRRVPERNLKNTQEMGLSDIQIASRSLTIHEESHDERLLTRRMRRMRIREGPVRPILLHRRGRIQRTLLKERLHNNLTNPSNQQSEIPGIIYDHPMALLNHQREGV